MPEAQKEQTQDDRLVPIDTSGEAVDVELKESKVTAVEEEVVEEQQEAAPEAEKTEEEKPLADKGEHDDYSEKVNKRIAKLVGKLREAERREDAAVKYAAGLKDKQTDLETQLQSLNQNYASTMETASTSQVEEAKLRLKKAIEEGDLYGIGYSAIVEPSISNMGYITTAVPFKEREKTGHKGGAITSASVTIGPTGGVYVTCDSIPQGQGHKTVLSQIVADVFGINTVSYTHLTLPTKRIV